MATLDAGPKSDLAIQALTYQQVILSTYTIENVAGSGNIFEPLGGLRVWQRALAVAARVALVHTVIVQSKEMKNIHATNWKNWWMHSNCRLKAKSLPPQLFSTTFKWIEPAVRLKSIAA